MARKPFLSAALIGLLALSQATPGLAEIYGLEGGGVINGNTIVTWTETHGIDQYFANHPGAENGYFLGGYKNEWQIAQLTNPKAGEILAEDNYKITYKITYDSLHIGIGGVNNNIRFVVNTQDVKISSSDLVLIATAEYSKEKESGGHWKCWWETIYGYGTDGNGNSFTFYGDLVETQADSVHYGYVTNFTLEYTASPVPIPGAVWLLGTGLLGLFCLKRRLF